MRISENSRSGLATVPFYGSLFALMLSLDAVTGTAGAAQVNWGSERFATNLTSEGEASAMGANFTFELGAFEPGFVPTVANRDEWVSRWHRAGNAVYNETFRFVTGSVLVDTSDPAFSSANQGYIWGFDSRVQGQVVEWILITNPAWMWPADSGIAAPVEWCVVDATTAVVGQINAPDGSCHMRTASLTLGLDANDPSVWRDATFGSSSSNPAIAGWEADPDGDGVSNLMEFALGTEALLGDHGAGINLGSEVIGGATYQTLSVERVQRPLIDYIAEVSSDLAHWSSGPDALDVVEDSEGCLTVRDRMPREGNRRFIRLSVRFKALD
jgi:hypothetical protein